jgi:hypothetical protein
MFKYTDFVGLTIDTPYYFRVQASNALGSSNFTDIANISTAPCMSLFIINIYLLIIYIYILF